MNTQEEEVIEMKTYQIETRVALLEQSIDNINSTLVRMEKLIESGFDKVDKRLDKMDIRLDRMDGRLDKMENRIWVNFYWVMGTIIGLSSIICGVIAKGFHWFG